MSKEIFEGIFNQSMNKRIALDVANAYQPPKSSLLIKAAGSHDAIQRSTTNLKTDLMKIQNTLMHLHAVLIRIKEAETLGEAQLANEDALDCLQDIAIQPGE